MKLIIDIPDNQYNQICELRLHNRTIYDDAIRNGIPLDKIRDEIDKQTEIHSDGEFYIKNFDVKRIINKYTKGESL